MVRPSHWREALDSCEETQHVPRRRELLAALGELLDAPELGRHPVVVAALRAGWPDLTPAQVVTDLLTHRALLAHCAPGLTADERAAVRADATRHDGWHVSDLPLLDVARQRLGLDPVGALTAAERARHRAAAEATVADLVEAAGEGSALHLLRGNASSADTPTWSTADLLEPADAPAVRTARRARLHPRRRRRGAGPDGGRVAGPALALPEPLVHGGRRPRAVPCAVRGDAGRSAWPRWACRGRACCACRSTTGRRPS